MTHTPTPPHRPGMTGGSMSETCDHPSTMWVDDETGWRCYDCGFVVGHLDPAPTNDEELAAAVLARSPEATDPTLGEVGLSEADKTHRRRGDGIHWRGWWYSEQSVERILAARTADLRAERDAATYGWLNDRRRAEAAEAERDAARREERMRAEDHARAWREVAELRATVERVEALDVGHSDPCTHPDEPCVCSVPLFDLRAALTAHRHEEA